MSEQVLSIMFYKLPSGKEPVREFLKGLSKSDRAKVGALLFKLQKEHKLSSPNAEYLGKQLWELRVIGENGKIRVMYCYFAKTNIILLHAFIKKSAKTPTQELELAMERKRYIKLLEDSHER